MIFCVLVCDVGEHQAVIAGLIFDAKCITDTTTCYEPFKGGSIKSWANLSLSKLLILA